MKRVYLEIEILNHQGLKVKYDLNHSISSFIYKILDDKELHNSKKIKNFTFSNLLFGSHRRIKSGILVKDNKGLLIVSSSEKDIIDKFIENVNSSIKVNTTHKISNLFMRIVNHRVEQTLTSANASMFYCETITPICLTKPGDRYEQYLGPDNPEYLDYLKKHLNSRFGTNINIEFMVDRGKAIKSKMVDIKGTNVRGFKYNFFIRCDTATFNELYYSGIGAKCSQGMGMIKLIDTQ